MKNKHGFTNSLFTESDFFFGLRQIPTKHRIYTQTHTISRRYLHYIYQGLDTIFILTDNFPKSGFSVPLYRLIVQITLSLKIRFM